MIPPLNLAFGSDSGLASASTTSLGFSGSQAAPFSAFNITRNADGPVSASGGKLSLHPAVIVGGIVALVYFLRK